MRPIRFFLLVPYIALLAAQTKPTFPFSTPATRVTRAVTVQDANGQPVGGLSAANFTVTQDGRVQKVVQCGFEDLALPAPGRLAAEPANGIVSEAPGHPRYSGRRLLVFYFDTAACRWIRSYPGSRRTRTLKLDAGRHEGKIPRQRPLRGGEGWPVAAA